VPIRPKQHSRYAMGFKVVIRSVSPFSSAGATSLLTYETTGAHATTPPSKTIGAAAQTKDLALQGQKFQFQLWDIAGGETFQPFEKSHYKDTDIFIACIDLTRRQDYQTIKAQIDLIEQDVPIFLLANKADLTTERRCSDQEVARLANAIGAKAHFICSAKTGQGVNAAFQSIYDCLLATHASHLVSVTSPYSPKTSAAQQPPLSNPGSLASQSVVASAPPLGNPPPYTVKPGPDEQSSWYSPQ
jgi:small GTP-binding protein